MSSNRGQVPRGNPAPLTPPLPQSPQSYERGKQGLNGGFGAASPLQPGSVLVGKSIERKSSAVHLERNSRTNGSFVHLAEWGSVMLGETASPVERGVGSTARRRTSQSTPTLPQISVEGSAHARQSSHSRLVQGKQPRSSAFSFNSSKPDGGEAKNPNEARGAHAWDGSQRGANSGQSLTLANITEDESARVAPSRGPRSSASYLNAGLSPNQVDSFAASSRSVSVYSGDYGYGDYPLGDDYNASYNISPAESNEAQQGCSPTALPGSQQRSRGGFRDSLRDSVHASRAQEESDNWGAQSDIDADVLYGANRATWGYDDRLNLDSGPSSTGSDASSSWDNERVVPGEYRFASIADSESTSCPVEFIERTEAGQRNLEEAILRAREDEKAWGRQESQKADSKLTAAGIDDRTFNYAEFLEERKAEGKRLAARKMVNRDLPLEDRKRLCNNFHSTVPRVVDWTQGPPSKTPVGECTIEKIVSNPQCFECQSVSVEWACNECPEKFFCGNCINASHKHHDSRHSCSYVHRLEEMYCAKSANGKDVTVGRNGAVAGTNPAAESPVSLLSLAAYDVFFPPCESGQHPIRESDPAYVCDLCDVVVCADCYMKGGGPKVHTHPLRLIQRKCIADAHMETWKIGERTTKDKRDLINNYVLIRELGNGTFAKVYLAQHIITRKRYAVKVLRLDAKEPLLEAIQNEIISIVRGDEQSVTWRPMCETHSGTGTESGASPRARSVPMRCLHVEDGDKGNYNFVEMKEEPAPPKKRQQFNPNSVMGQLQGSQVNMRSAAKMSILDSINSSNGKRVLNRMKGERIYAFDTGKGEGDAPIEKNLIVDERDKGSQKHSAFSPVANALREIAVMFEFQDDPRLVTLHEVCFDPRQQKLYLIMEWCSNGVVQKLNGAGADPEKVRKYGRDLRDILLALHDRSLFHLDVKPSNCLLDSSDNIKLADFGTVTGSPTPPLGRGTIGYQCPDVLLNEPATARMMDSWAFGMSLYEIATGYLPVPLNPALIRDWAATGNEVRFDPSISPDLKDLLEKLLARKPEERYLLEDVRNHPFFAKPANPAAAKVMSAFNHYQREMTSSEKPENVQVALKEYLVKRQFLEDNANTDRGRGRGSGRSRSLGQEKTFADVVRDEAEGETAYLLSGEVMRSEAKDAYKASEGKKGSLTGRRTSSTPAMIKEPHLPAGAKHRTESTVTHMRSPGAQDSTQGGKEVLAIAEMDGGTEAEAMSYLGRLGAPVKVSLRNCQLKSLTAFNTNALRELYLPNNELTEFPIGVLAAKKLKTLVLQHNRIATIPLLELAEHEQLTELDLSFNRISVIPYNHVVNALRFKNAISIRIHNNPILRIPPFFDRILARTITLPDSPSLVAAIDEVLLPHRLRYNVPAEQSQASGEASAHPLRLPHPYPVSWVDYGPVRILPAFEFFYLPMMGRWRSKCSRTCMELYRIKYVLFFDTFGSLIPQRSYQSSELKSYINKKKIWKRTSDVKQIHQDDDLDDEAPSRADVRPELLSDSVLDYVEEYDFIPIVSTSHLSSDQELENFMYSNVTKTITKLMAGGCNVLVVSPRFKVEYTWLTHYLTLVLRHLTKRTYMDANQLLRRNQVLSGNHRD